MGSHEVYSIESEWYTPKYIFDALECAFDWDIAAAPDPSLTFVPAHQFCSQDTLSKTFEGFLWCNPPWAGRGQKQPWIDFMDRQKNGLLLTPDRSSAPWWQSVAKKADLVIFLDGKVQFIPGPGNNQNWKQPGTGTTIFAWGLKGMNALRNAQRNKLGVLMSRSC